MSTIWMQPGAMSESGNLKMKDFHSKLYAIWDEIEISITENSMVNVYLDHIEAIK